MSYSQRWMRLLAFLPIFFLAQCDWGHIGYNTGYKPEQPLPFSHKLHAGEYKVSCVYCHTQVEQANHSAVPSLNICMNCHVAVATESPHIQELSKKYYDGDTVNWVKVHMLPDHVKFNHKRHVHRFSTPADRYQACQNCHGEVKKMEVVEQVSSLGMGWCVNCHREPEGYHTGAPPSSKDLKKIKGSKGNVNCSTCHH